MRKKEGNLRETSPLFEDELGSPADVLGKLFIGELVLTCCGR